MAYHARGGRDPLLDSTMTEAIEKRGKELLGLVLLVLAAMAAAMTGSYSPDDPSWMSATDAPVRNLMGPTGAAIAAPLFMIVGWGAWGLAFVLGAWGLRFLLHKGQERAIARLIFAPIWIALLSIYASSLTPDDGWASMHSFGLGGLFGDTVLGALLGMLPVTASVGLKLVSVALGIAMVMLGAFILGFTRDELRRALRFLLLGVIMTYAGLMAVLGRGAQGAGFAARALRAKAEAQRARRTEAKALRATQVAARKEPAPVSAAALRDMPAPELARAADARAAPAVHGYRLPEEQEPERPGGLRALMPALMRKPERLPEPELVEPDVVDHDADIPGEDRIRARITDVIKTRVRQKPEIQVTSVAPLTKGRGRGPQPLVLNTARADLPPEPPLTAARVSLPPEPPLTAASAHHPYQPEGTGAASPASPPQMHIPAAEPRKVVQHPPRKVPQPSSRALAESQPAFPLEETPETVFELPPLSLLSSPAEVKRLHLSDEALEENARMLESVLDDYGVKGEIVSVRPGPVVTMYELEPAPGLKASRVIGLADDIARSMSALSARVSTVPGRSVIGIELPNESREMVVLRELLSTRDFGDSNMKLPLALGKDIGGDPVISSLAKMPHLLIAGTTGSGKSVAINTMILSLLYKLTPDECRLIMIDPKMLELSVYDGIPHLLSPVVTDPKKAVVALKWVVGEMEDRYRKMSKMGVRNIDGYNGRVEEALGKGETFSRTVQTGFDDETGEPVFETEEITPEKMPFIVVIVDEMADLMMVAGKEIEACIQRLAQMARASGIHLIMATQRPSVDVITGTIKANFPTRISFQVTSKIDSRTILGEMGAEQLLGMGDMLYMAGGGKITRCHGPFVSDEEVEEVVNHLKAYGPPDYLSGVVEGPEDDKAGNIDAVLGLNTGGNTDGEDALYDQAVQIAIHDRKCSTSYIQRKLAIGYNKAARLVEQMEDEGIVSPANHVGKREILVPEPQ